MMDGREIEILRYFEQGPALVKPLQNRFSKSTAYRLIRKLVDDGLLLREGRKARLLPAGRAALELLDNGEIPNLDSRSLDRYLPHLQHMPTPLHKAVMELIACAIVARRHRLRTSHHPAFVLFAPKLKWKTWLARAACLMAGGDPAHDVIYLASESGRSMLTRKGSKGQRVTLRSALDKSVVGLDEYLRAKLEVRRLVEIYLFGELSVPDENGTLTIEPVPVVTLNPKEGAKSLEERLGLDEAMLRRSIPVDLSAVEIPHSILSDGDAFLDRMKELGGADFPPPKSPDWDPRTEMKDVLLATLDGPDRLAGIDLSMLAMLATGATAWLGPKEALELVIADYLAIVEHLGWTRKGWRDRLSSILRTNAEVEPEEGECDSLDAPNAFDYDAKLHALAAVCSELDLRPADAEQLLRDSMILRERGFTIEAAAIMSRELSAIDVSVPEAARVVAEAVREFGALVGGRDLLNAEVEALRADVEDRKQSLDEAVHEIRELGWDRVRVARLHVLDEHLTTADLSPEHFNGLIKAARDANELAGDARIGPAIAESIVGQVVELLRAQGENVDLSAATRFLAEHGITGGEAECALARLRAEHTEVTRGLSALKAETENLLEINAERQQRKADLDRQIRDCSAQSECELKRLRALEQERSDLVAQHRALASDISFSRELLDYLVGAAGPYDELWRRLGEIAQLIFRGAPLPVSSGSYLSDKARRRIVEILKRAVDEDLVARWEVDRLKQEARLAALQEFRKELAPLVDFVRVLPKAS